MTKGTCSVTLLNESWAYNEGGTTTADPGDGEAQSCHDIHGFEAEIAHLEFLCWSPFGGSVFPHLLL